jgi:phage baseplate assembly protein gpV
MARATASKAHPTKASVGRKVITGFLIVAAFALAAYLGYRQRVGRLDAFARCLSAKQAKMYGAYWCPHCADQKEMFGRSFRYVAYVECGVPGSRDEAKSCSDVGVRHFPTWQFGDGERREGTLPLQALGEKTGCGLP